MCDIITIAVLIFLLIILYFGYLYYILNGITNTTENAIENIEENATELIQKDSEKTINEVEEIEGIYERTEKETVTEPVQIVESTKTSAEMIITSVTTVTIVLIIVVFLYKMTKILGTMYITNQELKREKDFNSINNKYDAFNNI